jgi:tRNA threonylcarbamoyl adenosine modification protein (Sua5/YciO/YrdC/YwlC family)
MPAYQANISYLCGMSAEFIKLYEENPDPRKIARIIDILQEGGIIIYPTDTIYGIGCDLLNRKAVDRLCWIKGLKPQKLNLSFICADMSQVADYVRTIDNQVFRLMKKVLPGPYTFIMEANSNVPKITKSNKKTVGIRIPNNNIPLEIVRALGNPIVTTSLHDDDEIIEYPTDPEAIYEQYKNTVDLVIDGGYGGNVPSTVLDCTENQVTLIREGKGDISMLD